MLFNPITHKQTITFLFPFHLSPAFSLHLLSYPIITALDGGLSPRLYTLTVTSTVSEPCLLCTQMLYFPEFSIVTLLIVMSLRFGPLAMVNWPWLVIALSFRSQKASGAGSPSKKHVRHRVWGGETKRSQSQRWATERITPAPLLPSQNGDWDFPNIGNDDRNSTDNIVPCPPWWLPRQGDPSSPWPDLKQHQRHIYSLLKTLIDSFSHLVDRNS